MKWLRWVWGELIGLLVDDGFLAVAAVVAIAVTYLLSRDRALGTPDLTGWILFALLVGSTVASCRRAVLRHLEP